MQALKYKIRRCIVFDGIEAGGADKGGGVGAVAYISAVLLMFTKWCNGMGICMTPMILNA